MNLISSNILQRFLDQEQRKFEGVLSELIKRLILASSESVERIRMPSLDDIWVPGFDGLLESQGSERFVPAGISVWEWGTNKNYYQKLESDYNKRLNQLSEDDRSTITFCFVTPRTWAKKAKSPRQWELDHKNDGWKEIRIYDSIELCDWINAEPSVCAWLLEQFGERTSVNIASVVEAWAEFSEYTNPNMTPQLFLDGRDRECDSLLSSVDKTQCRVRSTTFYDAYGFCLATLMKDISLSNRYVVVKDEESYYRLIRECKHKKYLLAFPFKGNVSNDSSTIICYSIESTSTKDMIELTQLRSGQIVSALRSMGMADSRAWKLYRTTHGNLLSLFRKIPGSFANSTPGWKNCINPEYLCPLIFVRDHHMDDEYEKEILAEIAGVNYEMLKDQFERLLKIEDSPIKKVNSCYYIVNYEEAWMTLSIHASDVVSHRLHQILLGILDNRIKCEKLSNGSSKALIERMAYNYSMFALDDSEKGIVEGWVKDILGYSGTDECRGVIVDCLPRLADAAPRVVAAFLEKESNGGLVASLFQGSYSWDTQYYNVLWALDRLVTRKESAHQAIRILWGLCHIPKEYSTSNSPKDSLLNALCLWEGHAEITLKDKVDFVCYMVGTDRLFGVPLAIELIAKDTVYLDYGNDNRSTEVHIERRELHEAYRLISHRVFSISVEMGRLDWIDKALLKFWRIPPEEIVRLGEELRTADLDPNQKLPLIYRINKCIYDISKSSHKRFTEWLRPFQELLDVLVSDDIVSMEGWRFYKYDDAPFVELLGHQETDYLSMCDRARDIRIHSLMEARKRCGSFAIEQLATCMDDNWAWGSILVECLEGDERLGIARLLREIGHYKVLAGFINSVSSRDVDSIFIELSAQDKQKVLPLIFRNDIKEWNLTTEEQRAYWQSKAMVSYSEEAYRSLLLFNPSGILTYLSGIDVDERFIDMMLEVSRAILHYGCSDKDLLSSVVQKVDEDYYSDEWAEICIGLFGKGYLNNPYDYYPVCMRVFYYRHPDKMKTVACERIRSDYFLPREAYDDFDRLKGWVDYFVNDESDRETYVVWVGNVLGRSAHRECGEAFSTSMIKVLEEIDIDNIANYVAVGWLADNSFRLVGDGSYELEKSKRFREYARQNELFYPKTARVMNMIADEFLAMAKSDQNDSESNLQ